MKAILDGNLIAKKSGEINIYSYRKETYEYIGSSAEYLAEGVGIPANSSIDKPSEGKEGYAIFWNIHTSSWEYTPDHRGDTVYNIETGAPQVISALGEYPPETTTDSPSTPYDTWDGEKWITDTAAKKAGDISDAEKNRQTILTQASSITADWRTELTLGIISDDDKKRLIEWMEYIKAVKVIDASTAPDVNWPEKPAV